MLASFAQNDLLQHKLNTGLWINTCFSSHCICKCAHAPFYELRGCRWHRHISIRRSLHVSWEEPRARVPLCGSELRTLERTYRGPFKWCGSDDCVLFSSKSWSDQRIRRRYSDLRFGTFSHIFFTDFFQAALSMKTHTSEVCPSCQFGGQDPSVGTCFLESYPQPKPPSKVQSSQAHLTVGPHRAINLSSPARLPTIGSLIFYVGSDSKWFTSQHKIETCAYQVWKRSGR